MEQTRRLKRLLADCKYSEVIELADSLSAEEGLDRAEVLILKAEASLYLGKTDISSLNEAIDILRPTANNDLYARAKFLLGWSKVKIGRQFEATELLQESCLYFKRYNQHRDARRALTLLAQIAYHKLDAHAVETYTREILANLDAVGEVEKKPIYMANLARLYLRTGQLTRCQRILDKYKRDIQNCSNTVRVNYLLSSGLLNAQRHTLSEARDMLSEAKQCLSKGTREHAIFLEYAGQVALLAGDYAKAIAYEREALRDSERLGFGRDMVSQIKRLFGDLYVATEKYDLAQKYASEALEVATKINERLEIAACWRVFAQVEQYRRNDDKAREWYHKAIDLFNQISARYELAATRYLAATSGLYDNSEQTAMLYMAREYFASEEVTHYVEKVDRGLKAFPIRPVCAVAGNGSGCPTIIAGSPAMKKLVDFTGHVAQSEMNVLLTGPTGVGKDLMASYVHYASGRSGEFVTVNAAAIPNEMIESELFGHTKGAYTGANKDRPGLFEQADHGTFYLNEIADATPEFQAKLLEVLETRKVRRLGENKSRPTAFRLIAATNHDLQQRMRDNLFRVDLYHRLNEIPISLPPLCERTEDIPALVAHFMAESGAEINGDAGLLERLSETLSLCAWPGNVRQLRAEVSRLWMASRGDLSRMIDMVAEYEADMGHEPLLEVLEQTGGNRSEAARVLGISEGTVRYRLKKLDRS